MQNLIQNAVKYSKPNQKNTLTVTVNDTSNGVEIIVQDTGMGMDKERVSKLFTQVAESHATISNSHGVWSLWRCSICSNVKRYNKGIEQASCRLYL